MLKQLRELFVGKGALEVDKDGQAVASAAQVATAALLWEMAYLHATCQETERRAVVGALSREFGLSEEDAAGLLELAQGFAAAKKEGVDELIALINEHFSPDQKERVLAMLWHVAEADGRVDDAEAALTSELQEKLELTPEQWARARKNAGKLR